jgi:hypothetical protein
MAQSETKPFRTSYISFEIPVTWDCQLEQTEYVCQESGVSTAVRMIAIFAAKIADPDRDNPAVYASELGRRREYKDDRTGEIVVSQPLRSGRRCIGGYSWYWGKQYESELPNYYTEYFASIQNGIAVLVTVSYEKSVEAEGSPIASTIAERLRVTWRPEDVIPSPPSGPDCKRED